MFMGLTTDGIILEIETTLHSSALEQQQHGGISLAAPKTAILHLAKALSGSLENLAGRVAAESSELERLARVEAAKVQAERITKSGVDVTGVERRASFLQVDVAKIKLAGVRAAQFEWLRMEAVQVHASDLVKMRCILPALREMINSDKHEFVTPTAFDVCPVPLASQDIENYPLTPYGSDYFCKLCHQELYNGFMHCIGCENLLVEDYNICTKCYDDRAYETFHQMNRNANTIVSYKNHTGKMSGNNETYGNCGEVCSGCDMCPYSKCVCHTKFTYYRRFYNEADLQLLLSQCERLANVITD
jgi:hypothetical protein